MMVVKYRLATLVASHVRCCVVIKTITDRTGEGKPHASRVSLANW